jgi:gluconolactonase
VDSYEGGVYRLRPGGKSEKIAQLPEGHVPDGLKIDVNENLWITTYTGGGVDIIKPDGTYIDFLDTGGVPLNCVFEGENLIITDFGDIDTLSVAEPMEGRLWRIPVGVRGMELFRGAIA